MTRKGKLPSDANPQRIAVARTAAYELEYGTLKTESVHRRNILTGFLEGLREIPFDRDAAREAARIRVELEREGQRIGPLDLLIAGTAMSRGAALATNNTGEFSRIKGLRLEDWSAE